MKFILASASPRRKELFSDITEDFETDPSGSGENVPEGTAPEKVPVFLAAKKALEVKSRHPDDLIIGCDTAVLLDGVVLGKPRSKDEAKGMLLYLSGKTHLVITGCFLILGNKTSSFSCKTKVTFYQLSTEEIEEYANSDEPYDKAGGYGIQGKGKLFIKKIDGDYFNVMGLPVASLKRKINEFLSEK